MAKAQKKDKKRLNAFDVAIILLLICLIGTFGYRIYEGVADDSSKKMSEYVIEFECEDYSSLVQYLAAGSEVYLAYNGELLGYLYAEEGDMRGAAYTLPETESDETEEVETAEENLPIYEEVAIAGKIRLGSDAVKVKNGNYYSIGGINLTGGSVVEVYTENAVFTIIVKNIDTANE